MRETGESRLTKNKTVILLLIILLTLLWFVGEILVSYHWMKVNRYPVQVRNLRYTDTVTDAGFKMVVLSDLHDHEFGKDNEKLIRCVKEQDPKMIILDGDMLNEDSKSDKVPVRLVKGLAQIAPVYYALGNHELDYIGTAEGKKMQKHPENSELVKDLTDAGACVLEEGYRDVEIGGCKVRIGGMYEYAFALDGDNSAENLTGDVRDFLEEFQNTYRYKIMLCHRPDSFVFGDASDYWKIDLVISGHDHGGQVVIPFKGGLYGGDQGWFPPYVHGLYRTGKIRLFVTSGLSSEKQMLPRWNNRPEIAVLKVHGSDGESSKKMDRKTDRRDFTERNIRMKKLKVFSVILLLVSIGAFVAFQGYTKMIQDKKPPVVSCDSSELKVPVNAKEKNLLKGVTAKDNRSGDVSNTLVVENMSEFTDNGKRTVTYAAVDKSMNVGRAERTLVYEDYEPPVFHMTGSLCYAAGETVDVSSKITADSVLDGDLTSNIKYSLEKTVNTQAAGEYPIEFRVMDSGGNTVYLKTQISISDKSYAGIDVKLKDYLIYLSVGDAFDPNAYFDSADKEGELTVQSNVNTAKAGSYYVDYIVNAGAISGKSRLVVVVQ